MTTTPADRTVLPPHAPINEELVALLRVEQGGAALVGPGGERIDLPPEVFEVLRDVVAAMAAGQAVSIAPHYQRLTTQEAADLLGISRPTFVKLLESGEIDFEKPGRHRRVLLRDVLEYQERQRAARRDALDELVRESEDADLYTKTETPKRTR